MRRKTAGTVGTSVGTSCRRSWPFGRAGWRRSGRPWRRWRPRPRPLLNRPRSGQGASWSARGQGPAQLHRPGVPHHAGAGGKDLVQAYNCQAVVDQSWSGDLATPRHQRGTDKQQAVVMIEEVIANTGTRCPGKCPLTPVTLGPGGGRFAGLGHRLVRRAGKDPPRPQTAARPRGRIPKDPHPGTGCAAIADQAGSARSRYHGQRWSRCSARSSRAEGSGFCCQGEWSADLHRPQPAQAVIRRGQGGLAAKVGHLTSPPGAGFFPGQHPIRGTA